MTIYQAKSLHGVQRSASSGVLRICFPRLAWERQCSCFWEKNQKTQGSWYPTHVELERGGRGCRSRVPAVLTLRAVSLSFRSFPVQGGPCWLPPKIAPPLAGEREETHLLLPTHSLFHKPVFSSGIMPGKSFHSKSLLGPSFKSTEYKPTTSFLRRFCSLRGHPLVPCPSAWAPQTCYSHSTFKGVLSTLTAPCPPVFLRQTREPSPSRGGAGWLSNKVWESILKRTKAGPNSKHCY